jgi:hypothetical protein
MSLMLNDWETSIEIGNVVKTRLTLVGYGDEFMDFRGAVGKDFSEYVSPRKVIIRCSHCGQWGAVKCACKHCGAPMPE